MWGLDLHGWEQLMLVSLGFAALAAVFVTITTGAVVRLQKEESAHAKAELEKYQADAATELGKAKEATAKADERIAELSTQSAELKKDTAEANARAKEAELKLVEFRKNRSIGPEESDKIVAAIKPFAGTKFDIGHAPSGREQWDFLWLLEPVFPKAGWVFVDWVGPQVFSKLNWTMTPHLYGVANVLNVSVELSPEHRNELLPAAEALVNALKDVGIAATVEDHPISGTSTTADAIHILVGEKR